MSIACEFLEKIEEKLGIELPPGTKYVVRKNEVVLFVGDREIKVRDDQIVTLAKAITNEKILQQKYTKDPRKLVEDMYVLKFTFEGMTNKPFMEFVKDYIIDLKRRKRTKENLSAKEFLKYIIKDYKELENKYLKPNLPREIRKEMSRALEKYLLTQKRISSLPIHFSDYTASHLSVSDLSRIIIEISEGRSGEEVINRYMV